MTSKNVGRFSSSLIKSRDSYTVLAISRLIIYFASLQVPAKLQLESCFRNHCKHDHWGTRKTRHWKCVQEKEGSHWGWRCIGWRGWKPGHWGEMPSWHVEMPVTCHWRWSALHWQPRGALRVRIISNSLTQHESGTVINISPGLDENLISVLCGLEYLWRWDR